MPPARDGPQTRLDVDARRTRLESRITRRWSAHDAHVTCPRSSRGGGRDAAEMPLSDPHGARAVCLADVSLQQRAAPAEARALRCWWCARQPGQPGQPASLPVCALRTSAPSVPPWLLDYAPCSALSSPPFPPPPLPLLLRAVSNTAATMSALPRKQNVAEMKLRRLTENNARLEEELNRRRIKVSEASQSCVPRRPPTHLPSRPASPSPAAMLTTCLTDRLTAEPPPG